MRVVEQVPRGPRRKVDVDGRREPADLLVLVQRHDIENAGDRARELKQTIDEIR